MVTISATGSVAAGKATFVFVGKSGSLSHQAVIYATITGPTASLAGKYTLTTSLGLITLNAGSAGTTINVKANTIQGVNDTVSVTVSGLPAGVTVSPATLTLTPGTAQSMTLAAGPNAIAGQSTLSFVGTSGAQSHKATVYLTVVPAAAVPGYTLTASPASLMLTSGAAGSAISLTANASNGFTAAVKVAITGLPSGVTASPSSLTLTPGTAQSTTLTAASSAAVGTSTVNFTGTSSSLTHAAALTLTVSAPAPPSSIPDVTTYHYDVARDGLNAQETILTPTNVNSTQFGKVGFFTVDGHVDAEPLFLAGVSIGGQTHNVLYVATEHGSIYAFDADSGTQLWQTSLIESGETTSDIRNCTQITPEIGITATPVIDRKQGPNGTLFEVAMSKDGSGGYHQRLHAIDVTTGAEIGSPAEIAATYPGTGSNSTGGNVVFDPAQYAERSALLLLNGNIYTAWTSHCDIDPYTGWVMAFSESTLKQTQVLNLTPNGSEGAIWMAGDGLAADSAGSIYLLDANGTFDTNFTNGFPSSGDYGNAMLRLTTQGTLAVADYFETYNTVTESFDDTDLGSGGEILLPNIKDTAGTAHQLIVGAGKDGSIYLADRTNMGKFNPSTVATDSNIYQVVPSALSGRVFSTPAYFNGVLYYGAAGDSLRAFPFTNAKLPASASSVSAATFGFPGTTPAVSANGTQNGIVWALESGNGSAGVLHAYDPTNLANEFYDSNQAAGGRDSFGAGNKFITPLIIHGKVYVGTQTGVAVFGLLP